MRKSLETAVVHAGREDLRDLQVHALPLDLSTTYPLGDLDEAGESLEALAMGAAQGQNPIYARLHNPTVARFERALAALEGAEAAVAFGSGMAALTACLLAARPVAVAAGRGRGDHVVAIRPLYGGTDHLLSANVLGFDVTWVTPSEVAGAIGPHTALVIVETPANPTLKLVDIAGVVAAAGEVPVLVDSTFATPVLQRPIEHGAALVLHSATKFLGGHGDVVGGVVAGGEAFAQALRQVRVATGALLHPMGGYMLHRGLQTLSVRIEAAQQRAEQLARRLAEHASVRAVHYPGFAATDVQGLVGRQMDGPGTLVAFEIEGGHAAAARLLGHLELITPAVSLGSTDTLIQHPASLTHRPVDPEVRADTGICDGLLRLSVGLEGVEDLWRDLSRALDRAAP